MNTKFLIIFSGLLFTTAISVANTDPKKFTLINQSGYNIKYRNADQNGIGNTQEYLLENGKSVVLNKSFPFNQNPYSIRRSGFGSTITAQWWDIPKNANDLFKHLSGLEKLEIMDWNKSPSAKIIIYPGIARGWIFKGDYDTYM
jgi:hypothetical protein